MSYQVQRLTDHQAILATFNDDFEISHELIGYAQDVKALLDKEIHPIPIIVDLTRYNLSFDDLLSGTNLARSPDVNPAKHPKAGKFILVTKASLLKMSVDGFRKLSLVSEIQAVASLDEALALCAKT